MGGTFSTDRHPVIQVSSEFLQERETGYEEASLFDLISWTTRKGVEPTRETALDMNYRNKIVEQIIDGALKNDPEAVKVVNPWRSILNLIKQIKSKVQSNKESGGQMQTNGGEKRNRSLMVAAQSKKYLLSVKRLQWAAEHWRQSRRLVKSLPPLE